MLSEFVKRQQLCHATLYRYAGFDELFPLWLASPHPAELQYWKKCGVKAAAVQGY